MREMVAAAEWPKWLPERWVMEVRRRKDGKVDKYFIEPENNYVFRSKIDVIHYLESGEMRNRVSKRSPRSIKPSLTSDPISPSAGRELKNEEGIAKKLLFENLTSSCGKVQQCSVEPSSEGSHMYNSGEGGCNSRIDLPNLRISKAQVELGCKTGENQALLSHGITDVPQEMKPEQVARGRPMEFESVPTNIVAPDQHLDTNTKELVKRNDIDPEVNEHQSSKLARRKDVVILDKDTTIQNLKSNTETELPKALVGNAEVAKTMANRLSENEVQPVEITGEVANSAAGSPPEKGNTLINKIRGQSSKNTKIKVAPYLPRRSSRRLAGISVDPAVEIVSEWSLLRKAKSGATTSSDSLNPQVVGIGNSADSETTPMPAPLSSSLVEDKQPLELCSPETQPGTASIESERKNTESSISFPFGDTWPDPCIEFAFKTLTGDLPIFEDDIAIENFFHQHLSSKNCRPASPPPLTLNVLQPETPIQLDNVGRFNPNAVSFNPECTMKNGLQSSDMNRRLKRAKMK